MRVAMRADASARIGLGHVKRCLALACALREAGADVCLVSRRLGVDTEPLARVAAVGHIALAPPRAIAAPADIVPHAAWAGVAWADDAAETAHRLTQTGWRPDWIVVDHYAFDGRWHQQLAGAFAAKIAVIDDLGDRDLACELLVDHNLAAAPDDKYQNRVPQTAKRLVGPRFALLGAAYAKPQAFQIRQTVHSIGIFMGGVDAAGLSGLALQACREHAGFAGAVEIATTSANPNLPALLALAEPSGDTQVSVDLPDLAAFFSRHDLQIGAGGGATWERCRIGAPTFALVAADNQHVVIPALAALGGVATIDGATTPPTAAELGRALHPLLSDATRRRSLSERSQALVDGLGSRRVALAMAASQLTVRVATENDALTIHRWRNDVATRAVSVDAAQIPWEGHLQWLRNTLRDARRCLLVGRVGQIDVGVIRFDADDQGRRAISLYLDPALHGLGLGRCLLLAGEREVRRQQTQDVYFIATVLPTNHASQRMFQSCGYSLQDGLWRKPARSGCDENE